MVLPVDESGRKGGWIQLNSGRKYYPLDPRPEDFLISDIAHSLASLCRWNGHVDKHYSVAEHCLIMSAKVPQHLALTALMHDASEAYLGDVTRPLKAILGGAYKTIEARTQAVIAEKYGFHAKLPREIEDLDLRITVDERQMLFIHNDESHDWMIEGDRGLGIDFECLPREQAKDCFLMRFRELTANRWSHEQ